MTLLSGGSGGGGSQTLLTGTVTFTDAQIKALPAATVELVANPGAGQLIVPMGTVYFWKRTSAYTNVDAGGYMVLSDAGDNVEYGGYVIGASFPSFFNASGNAIWYHQGLPADTAGGPILVEPIKTGALHLAVVNGAAGNFTGGAAGNTLTVSVFYALLPVPT